MLEKCENIGKLPCELILCTHRYKVSGDPDINNMAMPMVDHGEGHVMKIDKIRFNFFDSVVKTKCK